MKTDRIYVLQPSQVYIILLVFRNLFESSIHTNLHIKQLYKIAQKSQLKNLQQIYMQFIFLTFIFNVKYFFEVPKFQTGNQIHVVIKEVSLLLVYAIMSQKNNTDKIFTVIFLTTLYKILTIITERNARIFTF